jgi:hypothetical protein
VAQFSWRLFSNCCRCTTHPKRFHDVPVRPGVPFFLSSPFCGAKLPRTAGAVSCPFSRLRWGRPFHMSCNLTEDRIIHSATSSLSASICLIVPSCLPNIIVPYADVALQECPPSLLNCRSFMINDPYAVGVDGRSSVCG